MLVPGAILHVPAIQQAFKGCTYMAKRNKGGKPTQVTAGAVAAAQAVQAAAAPAAAAAQAGVIQVTPNSTFRGARLAWYNALVQHNGQPLAAYVAACVATPPSLPKSGRPEAPSGWVAYFKRVGVLTIVQA